MAWLTAAIGGTRCRIAGFRPEEGMRSGVTGPDAHARVVRELVGLPGVRIVERSDDGVLLSVLRTAGGIESCGLGMFVLVRRVGAEVLLLGRRRYPLPVGSIGNALRQLELRARGSACNGGRGSIRKRETE